MNFMETIFLWFYGRRVIFQKQISCQKKLTIPKHIDLSPEGNDYLFLEPTKETTMQRSDFLQD